MKNAVINKNDNSVEITLDATLDNMDTATEFVRSEIEHLVEVRKNRAQLLIAVDEIFCNIAKYAYNPEIGPATIKVNAVVEEDMVELCFVDKGKEYNPLMHEDPDTTLSAEEREIGGLGILMVKNSMDDVSYEYKDGCNILKLRKCIR